MMVSVVISRATRVPCFILALSTLERQPTTYRGPDDALTMTVTDQLLILCTQSPQDGCGGLTSFLIQLFQHLADDLTNTLKCLDVLFGDIKLP